MRIGSAVNPEVQELESQLASLSPGDSPERVDLLVQFIRAVFIDDLPRAIDSCRQSLEMSRRLGYDKGVLRSVFICADSGNTSCPTTKKPWPPCWNPNG